MADCQGPWSLMEREFEDKSNISVSDMGGILMHVARFADEIEKASDVTQVLKPVMRGLASHEPGKRCGYAVILSALLEQNKAKITEAQAQTYLQEFQFIKNNKTKKSSVRTGTIAKILAYTAFIRAGILQSDEVIIQAIEMIGEIAANRPPLQPFIVSILVDIVEMTGYRFLDGAAALLPRNLDSFIFYFKITQNCPEEVKMRLPEQFQGPTPYNDVTAGFLQKTFLATRQPWNSMVWKFIVENAPNREEIDRQNFKFFWLKIFESLMKPTEDVKVQMAIIHVVKLVLPSLDESLFDTVICAKFIKMINRLIVQPMQQEPLLDFLKAVNEIAAQRGNVLAFANAFRFIDYRIFGGSDFHLAMFNKCNGEELRRIFEYIVSFGDVEAKMLKLFQGDRKSDKAYRFNVLRCLLIASAHVSEPSLSVEIFDYIAKEFADKMPLLVADNQPNLVMFDENRAAGSAGFQDLLKESSLPHFDSCFRLHALCTGDTSSPSSDTLFIPRISTSQPSTDKILLAVEKANEPPLLKHAFKTHLKEIAKDIPIPDLRKFFKGYVPTIENFSDKTVEMFSVVIENCQFSVFLISPLFQLFCNTLKVLGLSLGQSVAELVEKSTGFQYRQEEHTQKVVEELFKVMSELSNKTLEQNARLISRVFNICLAAVVKKSTLDKPFFETLSKQFDNALEDFAFKTNVHFTEDVFNHILELPDNIAVIMLPLALKHLPKVKRIPRRINLFNIITRILELPKGTEILSVKDTASFNGVVRDAAANFNNTVKALLNEDYMQSKDNEKKFMKSLTVIHKWITLIEKKRSACKAIHAGDIRRRLMTIKQMSSQQIAGYAQQILGLLQKIETKVHPGQRVPDFY